MEDKTKEGYDAINNELATVEASYAAIKIKMKESYKDRESANADAKTFNEMTLKIAKLKKLIEIREYYKNKFKGCQVDVFLEPPFDNCSILGYEKQTVDFGYDALKVTKKKVLVGVDYTGTVSTISNSINIRENGYYDNIFVLEHVIKSTKSSFYVRITKGTENNTIKFDDKSLTYIDVTHFKKPSKATIGYNLFKIFSYISSVALIAAFVMTILQTIGSNFIIGRRISKGKIESLGGGFVKFFSSPVLQIILLCLLLIYLGSKIVVFATTKHYNKSVPTKEYDIIKNMPTQIVNTIVILLAFTFFLFAHTVSFVYCAAPNLPYGEVSGIFSKLNFIQRFAEISHLETTRAFTFASNIEAAIYLGGVTISFCELVGMLYVIIRIFLIVIEILANNSAFYEVETAMEDRAKLTEKKLAEYETKFKEYNKTVVTIDDSNLFPGVIKRIPSVFDSESNFRNSKKIGQLQSGKFNPFRLFIPVILIPLMGIVFFVFDAIHDVCATNFFPGSNAVKLFGYFVLISISAGAGFIASKIYEKRSKLDN